MSSLADIGRANPVGAIQSFQSHDSQMENAKQVRAINDLKMIREKQDIGIKQRQIDSQIAMEKKLDTFKPLDVLQTQFMGGMEPGAPGEMFIKYAKDNGYMENQGGVDGMTARSFMKVKEAFLSNKHLASGLSRTRINFAQTKFNQAQKMLSEKPEDEKLKALVNQWKTTYLQAIGEDKSYSDALKAHGGWDKEKQQSKQAHENADREDTQAHAVEMERLKQEGGGEDGLPVGYHTVGSKLYKEDESGNLALVTEKVDQKQIVKSDGTDGLKAGTSYLKSEDGSIEILQEPKEESESKTTEIKNYEYAVNHPEFALQQKKTALDKIDAENAQKVFTNTASLRKEYLTQSKEFQKVRDSYTRVEGSTKDPSPAGDLSLIFNYMKMLDPGSVVRESEFATAATTGSYGERVKASVDRILTGERLSDPMRADFISKAKVLYSGMETQHNQREEIYRNLAIKNKLNPDDVVTNLKPPESIKPAPPAAIAYLKEHPESKGDFKIKYGYIPEGL